jgi:flagellar protein FlbD
MIKVTRLNRTPLIVNSDLIEHMDVTPDTVITLTSGQKYMVLETTEEIVQKVISFRRSLLSQEQGVFATAVPAADGIAAKEPSPDGK